MSPAETTTTYLQPPKCAGSRKLDSDHRRRHYDRSAALIEEFNAPGGTSVNFSGYYVYATWYLTGESRAQSYRTYPGTYNFPGTFDQIHIIHPVSAGGTGAWEVAARLSEINLNSGGFLVLQPVGVPSNIQGGNRWPQLVSRHRDPLHGTLGGCAAAGGALQPA